MKLPGLNIIAEDKDNKTAVMWAVEEASSTALKCNGQR
jgi:hypothetical protein